MKRSLKIIASLIFLASSPACLVVNLGEIRMGMDSAQVNDGATAKNKEQKPLPEEDISE